MLLSLSELKDILPNPIEIKKALDEYVIGQDKAKQIVATMLLNRGLIALKRHGKILFDSPLEKTNVLLLGNTGTGKTHLIRSLSEVAGVNILVYDVTSVTSAGYIGNKVEDILMRHVEETTDFIERSIADIRLDENFTYWPEEHIVREMIETGIIYLDEIDKMVIRETDKDINGEMVQNELLKVLEGKILDWTPRDSVFKSRQVIDTTDIMFICGGAFSGLSEIIAKRLNKNSSIGFTSEHRVSNQDINDNALLEYVTNEDLIQYGFKPEFLGRLPLKASLSPLTKDLLIKIILESKTSVFKQYQDIFKLFNINLRISDDGLDEIGTLVQDMKIGARSLKTIFSNLLLDSIYTIFDNNDKELIITKELVQQKGLNSER